MGHLPGFLGSERIAAVLSARLSAGTLPHACLLSGPHGSGRKTLARALARQAFCRDGCGDCSQCLMLQKDIHPDFRVFGAEGEWVRLEQAREFKAFLSYPPNIAPLKVAVLEECQRLTPEGANSLLRVLEDPPLRTLLVLTADNAADVLETIASRCQIFRLLPLEAGVIAREIQELGAPEERAVFLAGYSGGWLGRALELWHDQEFWQSRRKWAEETVGVLTRRNEPMLVAEGWHLQPRVVLEFIEYWFRDMLMLQKIPEHRPLNGDLADLLREAVASCPDEKTIRVLEWCSVTNRRLAANCNPRLATESLLLTLWEG